ncbi:LAFE_0E04984g1_1 [Lachancea fermentati]|uniref:Peptide hydrolase n=1 Tax=Lachancea fermentati TaxID=4955 RepID=A0A1G4MCP8_LACFM|nr:LAFE_0E04984g1_1 [Lachancea fermentati]
MLSQFVRSIFRFRKTTVSILLLLTYGLIGILYLWDQTRYKHSLPVDDEYAALIDKSWLHLQNFTHAPHPYASRENDRVHDYLLATINSMVKGVEFAKVSDDYSENASSLFKQKDVFNESSTDSRVIYYESSNILVKLNGTDPDLPGLLISAHFDSVPTGYGATDDGMGVATLLGLLSHFISNPPKRTIVFNFNNNEEFGLLGATVFFSHPWSKFTHYVLNLEGAGAGGKAVLFRTSDTVTASIYRDAVKSQPFGNSIYQQGFYSRYVSSETDYKVYEKNGLRGWDIAFYKPRDLYHTIKDSVQYTSRESLWHMMHTALQLTDYIAQEDVEDEEDQRTPAIYFDILGWKFVAFSAKSLYQFNCALLIFVPMLAALLQIIAKKRQTHNTTAFVTWLRLPCSLVISYLLVSAARHLIFQSNPLVFNRDHWSPTISFATLFILTNYLILSFCEFLWPVQDFKTVALRELSIGLWLPIFLETISLFQSRYKNTGIYPFTFVYTLVSVGALFGLVCNAFKQVKKSDHGDSLIHTDEEQTHVDTLEPEGRSIGTATRAQENDERSPLLNASQSSQNDYGTDNDTSSSATIEDQTEETGKLKKYAVATLNYDWSIQFLTVIPLTSFFMFMSVDVILEALDQTCQEGFKSSWSVVTISMIGGILIALPLVPFTYKLNYVVMLLMVLACAVSFMTAMFESPFTQVAPLKLRFSQDINLYGDKHLATVNILGRQGEYISTVLEDLPSVKQNKLAVDCVPSGLGTEVCSYPGITPNLIDSHSEVSFSEVMRVEVLRNNRNSTSRSPYEPIVADLKVHVKQNRVCTLAFNSTSYGQPPLKQVTFFHEDFFDNRTSPQLSAREGYSRDDKGNDIFRWNAGIKSLELHKLDFDKGFYRVGLQWMPKVLSDDSDFVDEDILGVTLECYWGEYDADVVIGGETRRRVPAYDELLEYSPRTVSYANKNRGMVVIRDYLAL